MNIYASKTRLTYPEMTMFQLIEREALAHPKTTAYEFFDKKTSYGSFLKRIETAARAFTAMGIRQGDVITICMPNTPQAIDCFYAISRIGAIANMVHPQSAKKEISFYLNFSKSKMILTLDMFCEKVEQALTDVDHPVTILVARMQHEMKFPVSTLFELTKGKAFLKYPNTDHAITWTEFLKKGTKDIQVPMPAYDTSRTAAILYSGGTSGEPKGICLSDLNFNACAIQAKHSIGVDLGVGHKMLSCMPVFHGFGLGINIHTILIHGATCILMPTFDIQSYTKMLTKKKPNFIAGVPTIFEALLHMPDLDGVDLSFLMGMFCGGDCLSIELKKKVDTFLKEHGATIQIREGYGLTECVTACCLTPLDTYREGSIGLPFIDTQFCIVKPGTDDEVPLGQEGEIILKGPTLMLEYRNNPEETADAMRTLADGDTWLFTGDLGKMDADGYVYFSQRIKRIIVTNGYNVYPGRIENVIDSCPEVSYSCVIGVKDPRRVHRVKAFVVLKDGVLPSEAVKARIMDELEHQVAKYALPKEIEFRDQLPKTLVGKVAYRFLEEEEDRK